MSSRRYTAVFFIFVAAAFFFQYYFISPRSAGIREAIEVQYTGLRLDQRTAASSRITGDDVTRISDEIKNAEKRIIREKTELLASAKLQSVLSEMASKSGIRLQTIKPMPVSKYGAYVAVPIYFEGSGFIRQIGDFLRYAETGGILVKVDKMSLSVMNLQSPKEIKFKMQISAPAKI